MDILLEAALTILEPANLAVLLLAVVAGIVIGAIPGLTVNMAVALAVPFTLTMSATPSILMLLALYCAGIYGGSISAILINAPGTPGSAATSIEGYELGKRGMAGKALKMAVLASVYGGLFSVLVLILVAPQLASFALRFGPSEMAALLVFALTIVAVLSTGSMLKGLLAAAIGMVLATVGADPMVAVPRFTFGNFSLFDGLQLIPLLIGLFALSEMFVQAEKGFRSRIEMTDIRGADREANRITRDDLRRSAVPIVRSGFLGVFVGMLPGLGASIATFLGYAETRRASKEPHRFGKGAIEGVAASESANNAVTGSTLIPLLALSIPGDSVTAILLGALLIQGVTPGPLIFSTNPSIVYTIYLALLAVNLVIAVVALFAIRPMAMVLKIPKTILYPIILVLCVAGSYVIRNDITDVYVMLGGGVLGYVLRVFGVPVAPLLIAFILTPPFEESLRQALIRSEGSPLVFLTRPISAFFLALAALAIFFTWRRSRTAGAVPLNQ